MTPRTRSDPPRVASVEDPLLSEIVSRLATLYQPLRIYLFGSKARGARGPDSDYDIMVVVSSDTPPEIRESDEVYKVLWGIKASVDVLVWTQEAFEKRLVLKASLPSTIVREGKLLYAA